MILAFALHALAEKPFKQPFAVLTDGGAGVGVNNKGVRDLHPSQHYLLHPDWPAAP